MRVYQRRAVILDYLIPLSTSFIRKAFNLRVVGRNSKELVLHTTNPVTGVKEIAASIYITVNIDTDENDFINLQYNIDGKQVNQQIQLLVKKDNLKRGNLFYFQCPATGVQRRKLFLYGGRFVSKLSIPNPHYKSQLQSRKQRNGMKEVKKLVKLQNMIRQAENKRCQKYYNGSPIKRWINTIIDKEDLNASW